MRLVLLAALLAAPFATPAVAQAPSPAALQSASALVELLSPRARESAALEQQLAALARGDGFRQAFGQDPRFQAAAQRDRAAFDRTLSRAGAALVAGTAPIQREMLTARRTAAARAFAARMTPAELDAAVAFLRSPVGAKLIAAQGPVQASVAEQVNRQFAARIQAANRAAEPRIRAELQKLVPAG